MVRKRPKVDRKEDITQYTHATETRVNIPPTGLVTTETDPLDGITTYKFDPHLDPELQWAGKAEGVSFNVDMVSLHVHERIDPLTIIEAVRKKELENQKSLFHYFESPENNLPIREAIEFYKHSEGWSNRLIAGDSLLVMNSLLEKEGLGGKVQMIYIDPPYGIKYGSNFQPFINKKEVKDGKDEDLTQEPETIKAFRDTWELGIHSYLTYLRNRLLLARDLLSESGSIFIQMNDENIHHVRELVDEVFGPNNFIGIIAYQTATNQNTKTIQRLYDYIIWYSKTDSPKIRHLFRKYTEEEKENIFNNVDSEGRRFKAAQSRDNWTEEQIKNLKKEDRLISKGKYVKRFETDFEYTEYDNVWYGTVISTFSKEKVYAVQTSTVPIKRCILMTTDPGDLVLDITCGSGTTAYAAEYYGRRWITCDTSRVAIALAKERLMTAIYDYYELAQPKDGISSGFKYNTAPHRTIKSVADGEPARQEILYDQPIIDKNKKRITGPFTLEAVPSQQVRSLDKLGFEAVGRVDNSIARSGESIRLYDWINEISKTGIRGSGGQLIQFIRVEAIPGTKWIHAKAETKEGQEVAISFGPDYAPLEQRQVELAIEEAQSLVPKPKLVVFASFQFDPEAAKDIDQLKWQGVRVLKCQMNTDLLTSDLKRNKASNESFWLIGQPDVELTKNGEKYTTIINGFDYYNIKTGEIESGDISKIAMWELDTDYDGRSLYPRQVFFPMSGDGDGWEKLAKSLRAYIDEELIENYKGNRSIPFKVGKNKQVAIKIIDDRGVESLRIIKVD